MDNKSNEFTRVLKLFISRLEASGKAQTAQYYQNILDQFIADPDSLELLDRVINSGSISQYANLTSEEDEVFEKLYKEAVNLKDSLSKRKK